MGVETSVSGGGPRGQGRGDTPASRTKGRTVYRWRSEPFVGALSWVEMIFFSWVNPVVRRFSGREVEPDDLPSLSESDDVRRQAVALQFALNEEEGASLKNGSRPSIFRAIFRVFWLPIFICLFWSGVREALVFVNAFLLKKIMQQGAKEDWDWKPGLIFAALLSTVQFIRICLEGQIDFYQSRVMTRIESGLLSVLYRRMLGDPNGMPPAVLIRVMSKRSVASEGSACVPRQHESNSTVTDPASSARNQYSQVFNLVFVDIPSISDMVLTSVDFLLLPLRIGLAATMLVMQVEERYYSGLLTVCIVVTFTISVEIYNSTLKKPYMHWRDRRLAICYDALREIRLLRFLGIEDVVEQSILKERRRELEVKGKRIYLSAVGWWLSTTLSLMTSMATFAAYVWPFVNGEAPVKAVNVEFVIPVLHCLDALIGPISDLPYAISSLIEGFISLRRIEASIVVSKSDIHVSRNSYVTGSRDISKSQETLPLLFEQEDPHVNTADVASLARHTLKALHNSHTKVCFSHCWFSWDYRCYESFGPTPEASTQGASAFLALETVHPVDKGATFALRDISLDINAGKLLVVTGPPGSGKSTLIRAVVNQLEGPPSGCQGRVPLFMSSGSAFFRDNIRLRSPTINGVLSRVHVPNCAEDGFLKGEVLGAPVGFVDQRPWLCGGSVRENVLFGEPYDPELYNSVIKACALDKDIKSWRGGDQWPLGEGGAPLSGGQRIRVCIARAVYVCLRHEEEAKHTRETISCDVLSDLQMQLLQIISPSDTLPRGTRTAASCCQKLKDMDSTLLKEKGNVETRVNAQVLGGDICCLYCFDDAFTALDVSVASSIFNSLFGPGGILSHAAVLLTLNEQTLSSIVFHPDCRWFLSSEACTNVVAEPSSPELKGSVEGQEPSEIVQGLQTQILRVVDGEEVWRGTPVEYKSLVTQMKHMPRYTRRFESETIENIITLKTKGQHDTLGTSTGKRVDEEKSTTRTVECIAETIPCRTDISFAELQKGVKIPTHRRGIRTLVDTLYTDKGVVKLETYRWYLRHVGWMLLWCLLLFVFLASIFDMGSDVWLTKWADLRFSETGKGAAFRAPIFLPSVPLGGSSAMKRQSLAKSNTTGGKIQDSLYLSYTDRGLKDTYAKYLWTYMALAIMSLPFALATKVLGAMGALRAARSIHKNVLSCILGAPFAFYDRLKGTALINCFTTEMAVVDEGVFRRIEFAVAAFVNAILALSLLLYRLPPLALFFPFAVFIVYKFIFRGYRSSSRTLQRVLLASVGSLSVCFGEAPQGATVIRAMNKQRQFEHDMETRMDICQRAKLTHWAVNAWSSVRLQLLLFPLLVLNASLPSVTKGSSGSDDSAASNLGLAGLAIAYSISGASEIRKFLMSFTHLEEGMCAPERIKAYVEECEREHEWVKLQQYHLPRTIEGQSEQASSHKHNSTPTHLDIPCLAKDGLEVVFKDVSINYGSSRIGAKEGLTEEPQERGGDIEQGAMPLRLEGATVDLLRHRGNFSQNCRTVLPTIKNLNAVVKAGECVGVVGRTGSGKSTLLNALCGLIPVTKGNIFYSGVPVGDIPRSFLRQIVGTLPQTPFALKGWRVRDVVDPKEEYTDDDVWAALGSVGVALKIRMLKGGLGLNTLVLRGIDSCGEGSHHNSNAVMLSQQQVRYLTLARLVLNRYHYRILLVDEPPPEETWQQQPQQKGDSILPVPFILKEHFSHCCIFIVSHHLSSLRICSKVWLLDAGELRGVCTPKDIENEELFSLFVAGCMKSASTRYA